MSDERGAASALKGRLADVYLPALVEGATPALSKRLGNRATIDDPLFGRASTLSSIEPMLEKFAAHFKGATYRQVASATGVDRDVSEGVLVRGTEELPIAIVAERRRLREIELRVYYATGLSERRSRAPMLEATDATVPQVVLHVIDALRKGAVERVLAAFEASARFVDPEGKAYSKKDGAMATFVSDVASRMQIAPAGAADDGRCCCVEAVMIRTRPARDPEPAALTFERGESGLLRELRFYYEP